MMMDVEDMMNSKDSYDELLATLEEHAIACPAAALAVKLMHVRKMYCKKATPWK
jgi:hypothetical protein